MVTCFRFRVSRFCQECATHRRRGLRQLDRGAVRRVRAGVERRLEGGSKRPPLTSVQLVEGFVVTRETLDLGDQVLAVAMQRRDVRASRRRSIPAVTIAQLQRGSSLPTRRTATAQPLPALEVSDAQAETIALTNREGLAGGVALDGLLDAAERLLVENSAERATRMPIRPPARPGGACPPTHTVCSHPGTASLAAGPHR